MRHFLLKYTAEHGKHITGFTKSAVQSLALYDWPGNIRELEHLIERAVVMAQGSTIEAQDIEVPAPGGDPADSFQRAKARAIEAFETRYICGLLIANEGNISQAARAAQKNRRAFWQLIRKHRIDVERFKSPSHTRTVPAPP
jgi:two-component system response regulator GlrR